MLRRNGDHQVGLGDDVLRLIRKQRSEHPTLKGAGEEDEDIVIVLGEHCNWRRDGTKDYRFNAERE